MTDRRIDKQHDDHRYGPIVATVLAAVAFYVLNVLSPEYHDDFLYKFMVVNGSIDLSRPVGSIGDIIQSQIEHYRAVNGRSVVHLLVQVFTGLLGKQVFNVFNALMFGLFVWLLQRNLRSRWLGIPLALALVLMMPRFKDTFLWMTGSVNYLWSATGVLVFLMIYESRRDHRVSTGNVWLLPIAVLLGWTHEGIVLPLAVALILLQLRQLKSGVKTLGFWLTVSFLAGACIAALAPGTLARSGVGGMTASMAGLKVITGFTVLGKLKIVYLAIALSLVAAIWRRAAFKQIVRGNVHLLLAALLSLGIVFASGLESARTAFGLELFMMVYVLRLVNGILDDLDERVVKCCGITLTAGVVAFFALLLWHTVGTHHETQRLIAQIEQTQDGIIATQEHDAGIFASHICTMISPDATVNAMNYDPKGWPASIAATYGRDSLVFLPQAFLDDLKNRPGIYEHPDASLPHEFFVKRLAEDEVVDSVCFDLKPAQVPSLLRPIARRMSRFTETRTKCDKWVIISLYGNRYLIIKRIHDLDDRLIDIDITTHHTS